MVMAVGGAGAEPTPCQGPDAMAAHHPLHPPATGCSPLRTETGMHPRRAVVPVMLRMNAADIVEKATVGSRTLRTGSLVVAQMDPQQHLCHV